VRNAIKDRLIITGLILLALPFAVFSVPWTHKTVEAALDLRPWAHVTVETSLNLLWLSLAVGALVRWVAADHERRRSRFSGLVGLIFVLSLLFPVISASDDLAQLALINDVGTSQSIIAGLHDHKHQLSSPGLSGRPALLPFQVGFSLPLTSEFVSEPARPADITTPGEATGNHSPPRC
jgi:hypothetical protein